MANSQVVSHTKITQIDFARAGEITSAMRIVAEKEGRAPEFIREGVAAGRTSATRRFPPRAWARGFARR